jgi:hypothetical protein
LAIFDDVSRPIGNARPSLIVALDAMNYALPGISLATFWPCRSGATKEIGL